MRHATVTELALYLSNRLNEADCLWIRNHVDKENCPKCSRHLKLAQKPLEDFQSRKLKKPWPWEFKRLWNRIRSLDSDLDKQPVPANEPAKNQSGNSVGTPLRPVAALASAAGTDEKDYPKAPVIGKDERLSGDSARAGNEVTVQDDGSLKASIWVYDRLDQLVNGEAYISLSDGFDQVTVGPGVLQDSHDERGRCLEASVGRLADPPGGLSADRLKQMSASWR
jgi:hypothetical protein